MSIRRRNPERPTAKHILKLLRALETQGEGRGRRDCMKQFKAAWERFAADDQSDLIS